MSFAKKIVLISGAGSGIGAATSLLFARNGANVVLVGRNADSLQKVGEECSKTGNEPLLIKADITNDDEAKRIFKETIGKYNQLDVLVNNAGTAQLASILGDNIMSIYDAVMNINLRAQVHMTHLAAPHLIQTKGNIINISSVSGKGTSMGKPGTCYAVSKAALDHFTRNVAVELAVHGVRVNTVSPGPVRTDIYTKAGVKKPIDDIGKILPLKRISEPEEVADLIMYLASEKAKSITGSDFLIDNGAAIK